MPKLSYLVSSYDSGSYLAQHLADFQNQTDPDFEVIVVVPDSPGTDAIVARQWVQRDSRIKLIEKDEREPYGTSWLTAWEAAQGDFVVNSNSDDFHHPRFTEVFHTYMSAALQRCPMDAKQAAICRVGPPVGFSYAGIVVRDETGRVLGQGLRPPFNLDLFSRECHCGPQVCWRNDAAFRDHVDWEHLHRRASVLDSGFDYACWLYFMSLGYIGLTIPEILTIYTQRHDSIENRNKWLNNWDTFVSIAEYFPHHIGSSIKGVDEFKDFPRVPHRATWAEVMNRGDKWKDSYGWQTMD